MSPPRPPAVPRGRGAVRAVPALRGPAGRGGRPHGCAGQRRALRVGRGEVQVSGGGGGSRGPSGLRKTTNPHNSLAHRTTWVRTGFNRSGGGSVCGRGGRGLELELAGWRASGAVTGRRNRNGDRSSSPFISLTCHQMDAKQPPRCPADTHGTAPALHAMKIYASPPHHSISACSGLAIKFPAPNSRKIYAQLASPRPTVGRHKSISPAATAGRATTGRRP